MDTKLSNTEYIVVRKTLAMCSLSSSCQAVERNLHESLSRYATYTKDQSMERVASSRVIEAAASTRVYIPT